MSMKAKNNLLSSKAETTVKNGGRKQTFSFSAPGARSVQLVGDFTRWQQRPINLQKTPDGTWRTNVDLEKGAHHYRFMVDGEWRDDPECTVRVPNAFGSQDCIRQVG